MLYGGSLGDLSTGEGDASPVPADNPTSTFRSLRLSMKKNATGGLVYSTAVGRTCPGCRRPIADCVCGRPKSAPPVAGPVRVSRETKGRGGKCVTLVKGLALAPDALTDLGKRLKAACGSGGTVKDGVIEVQGDHCDRVLAALQAEGIAAKKAGG